MDRILLAGGDVAASRLGFGCASLMGRTGKRESVRLLEVAFAAGITHFDVARSYGYGEAESAVGAFAAGRRDEVTIATKLGIAAPARSRALDLARAAAKRVVAAVPATRKLVRRQAERLVAAPAFALDDARESFETSLRELGTDHVDILFLHDCEPDDVTPELLGFLEARVAAGQARAFGIATGAAAAAAILERHPSPKLIAQVPFDRRPAGPRLSPPGGLIVHSVLAQDPELAGAPERGSELLREALERNRDGVTLVSSRDEGRIRANAAAAERLQA